MMTGFSASILGVGGSVLTVPHFRKQGLSMSKAVPLAAMLTLPISIFGFSAYLLNSMTIHPDINLNFHLGYIYFPAAFAILIGSYFGVPIGVKIAQVLPDRFLGISRKRR